MILPVTKSFPVEAIEYAYKAGFKAVGENKVQEVIPKNVACAESISWELIGHLQTNKAKMAVKLFDRIQSVDSLKLLSKIDTSAESEGKKMRILVQINTGKDPSKFGVCTDEIKPFFEKAITFKNILIEGLMTIAPLNNDTYVAHDTFAGLRKARDELEHEFGLTLQELSMGMTADLAEAITEGSTIIRIGSGLLGCRTS